MTSLLRWTHKLCCACFGTAILGKQNKIYFSLLFSSVQSSILQFCKRGFRHFFVSSLFFFFSVSILARFLLYRPEKHICILLSLEFFWELVFYVLTRPCFGIPEMGGCILQRPRKNLADGSFFLKNIVFRYRRHNSYIDWENLYRGNPILLQSCCTRLFFIFSSFSRDNWLSFTTYNLFLFWGWLCMLHPAEGCRIHAAPMLKDAGLTLLDLW